MNVSWVRKLALAVGLCSLTSVAMAQQAFAPPPLVPVPSGYPAYPASLRQAPAGAPAAAAPAAPATPDAAAPMSGDMAAAVDKAGCGCNAMDGCMGDCCARWYAGVNYLAMRRDDGSNVGLSFDNVDRNNIVMDTHFQNDHWQSGFELTLGYCLGGCNCDTSIEASYWAVNAMDGSALFLASAQATGALDSLIDFTGVSFNNGTAVAPLYDTVAGAHLLVRDSRFHNIEINLVHAVCGDSPCKFGQGLFGCGSCDSCCNCSCWGCTWLAGVRYLQYYDNLLFASSDNNEDFVFDANEAYYGVNVYNHLIGAQIGARLTRNWGNSITFFATPKIGLYGNHMNHQTRLYTLGAEVYDIRSSKNDVAMMGELSLGTDIWLTCRLKATIGYRALAIAGVANSEDQLPSNAADTAAISDINSSGEVIVHGAFAGLEYRW